MTKYTFNTRKRSITRNASGMLVIPLILVIIVVIAVVWLAMFGVALGAANAWIIEGTFSDAWHQVWNRWPISLLWGFLFGGFIRWTRD